MAFLQLKSMNPKLSYLIRKNPSSGLFAREFRQGVVFGYFSHDEQTYNVYFRDSFTALSYPEYKGQEFEYVNATRYNSAQFVLNALSDVFRDALKKRDEELDPDDKYTTDLFINMMRLGGSARIIEAFKFHFSSMCSFEIEEVAHKSFRIKISTTKSLFYLLNIINLFAAFNVLRNKTEYFHLDEGSISKYFSSLYVIDAPYFIRYHFKVNLLRNNKVFKQYKPLLEKSEHYPIEMVFGDAARMRRDMVESQLNFSNHIVDIGCGEGVYVLSFNRRMLKGNKYYAIDKDESCRNSVFKKIRIKRLVNVVVLDSIDSFLKETLDDNGIKIDFILAELIEHMSLTEATDLVTLCLKHERCNSVILTTPNRDFNKFFSDECERDLRHPDHQFEFTSAEFNEWLDTLSASIKRIDIGDKVEGIPMTFGAVLSPT